MMINNYLPAQNQTKSKRWTERDDKCLFPLLQEGETDEKIRSRQQQEATAELQVAAAAGQKKKRRSRAD